MFIYSPVMVCGLCRSVCSANSIGVCQQCYLIIVQSQRPPSPPPPPPPPRCDRCNSLLDGAQVCQPCQLEAVKDQIKATKGWVHPMFHIAPANVADIIVSTQQFRTGTGGLAGAGAYFCAHPDECVWKANCSMNNRKLVTAAVYLGRMHIPERHHDVSSMTYTKLNSHPLYCNSVCLTYRNGNEYVIYSPQGSTSYIEKEKIKDIRVEDPKNYTVPVYPRSKMPPPQPSTRSTTYGQYTFTSGPFAIVSSSLLQATPMIVLVLMYNVRVVLGQMYGVPTGCVRILCFGIGSLIVNFAIEHEIPTYLGSDTCATYRPRPSPDTEKYPTEVSDSLMTLQKELTQIAVDVFRAHSETLLQNEQNQRDEISDDETSHRNELVQKHKGDIIKQHSEQLFPEHTNRRRDIVDDETSNRNQLEEWLAAKYKKDMFKKFYHSVSWFVLALFLLFVDFGLIDFVF